MGLEQVMLMPLDIVNAFEDFTPTCYRYCCSAKTAEMTFALFGRFGNSALFFLFTLVQISSELLC